MKLLRVRAYLSNNNRLYIGFAQTPAQATEIQGYFAHYKENLLSRGLPLSARIKIEQEEAKRIRINCETWNAWCNYARSWREALGKVKLSRNGVWSLRGRRTQPTHKVLDGFGIKYYIKDLGVAAFNVRTFTKDPPPSAEEWDLESAKSRGVPLHKRGREERAYMNYVVRNIRLAKAQAQEDSDEDGADDSDTEADSEVADLTRQHKRNKTRVIKPTARRAVCASD